MATALCIKNYATSSVTNNRFNESGLEDCVISVLYSPRGLGRVPALQEALLTQAHFTTFDLHRDEWEAFLQGPRVHHCPDVHLVFRVLLL